MSLYANQPPPVRLIHYATSYWVSHALSAAAELSIADAIGDEKLPVAEIAKRCGTDAFSTFRLLRALATVDIFSAEGGNDMHTAVFSNNVTSSFLKDDHSQTQRPFLLAVGGGAHAASWPALVHGLKTGSSPFHHTFGKNVFEYYAENMEEGQMFSRAMISVGQAEVPVVLPFISVPDGSVIVDVGGGYGDLLAAVMTKTPGSTGVLQDLPQVCESDKATQVLTEAGVNERVTRFPKSFLEDVQEGGDVYMLKHILHDWGDEQSVTMLTHIRKNMKPGGIVYVIDSVVDEGSPCNPFLDLNMLVMCPGGVERTRKEFSALFDRAGLQLKDINHTNSVTSVVSAVAKEE